MIQVTIRYLQMICVGMVVAGCSSKAEKEAIPEKPHKQIKTMLESVHDPVKNSDLGYSERPSENSVMNEFVFNQKGELIKKSMFNSKGNLEQKVTFRYDVNGQPLETDEYSFDGSLTTKEANKFNAQNKLIESDKIDVRGKIISKQSVQFLPDGTEVITIFTLINQNFVKEKERTVNEKGQTIRNNYFTHGTLTRTDSSWYDARGNPIETIAYNLPKNEKIITQYKYDDKNNVTGMIVFDNTLMITSKVLSKYDEQNNLVESLTYGMLGSVTRQVRHLYEYDDAFNWTKKITFVNSRPVSVTIHRIEYY